ncbi:MAG TPA: GerMN domain-containing protein [Marmoricola sp.]|nr:GerMN domain-containing protein [Marmoricola sp.]
MGPVERRVYFVRSGRLVAVERRLSSGSVTTALESLVAGPTRTEVATGVRTSVAPQSFRVAHPGDSPRVVEVTAGPQFTSVSGQDQLLAVAQVVWTVTEVPGIRLVRFYLDRSPLEVPTDDGLARHAVGRSDYMSVRPTDGS